MDYIFKEYIDCCICLRASRCKYPNVYTSNCLIVYMYNTEHDSYMQMFTLNGVIVSRLLFEPFNIYVTCICVYIYLKAK